MTETSNRPKLCKVAGGNCCSCRTTESFCEKHQKLIQNINELAESMGAFALLKPPLYKVESGTCEWGSTTNPMARCLNYQDPQCGNLCLTHFTMFKNNPSLVPDETRVEIPVTLVFHKKSLMETLIQVHVPESLLTFTKNSDTSFVCT